MNPNRLVVGVAIFVAISILLGYGLLKLRPEQPRASQRAPIAGLGYCDSNDVRPCIVSFSLDSDGNMLVNVLVPGTSFPKFYLKIAHAKGESMYECKKVEGFPANFYCIGQEMHPGEKLQFMIFSREGDILIAEGDFTIVGLALSTPEVALPTPTIDLTVSPTPDPLKTPTPNSYPNPYP